MIKEKIILTDADGCLTNWEYAFNIWMEDHGYTMSEHGKFVYSVAKRYNISNQKGDELVRFFNESAFIGFLPALRDAEHWVRLLGTHGYKFHVITSLSKNPYAQELRTRNLEKLFGNVFENIVCLDTGEDKDIALNQYKDTGYYWIEDKIANVDVGLKLGLKGLLMEHAYNLHYEGKAQLVKNWEHIYKIIIN